jgi:lactoylglutathione lyase
MRSPRLNLVVLRSAVPDRAAKWYGLLGLSFSKHAHGSGPEHYSAESAGSVFEIYPATEKMPVTASIRIGFVVESVDRAVADLTGGGAAIVSAPSDSEWGRRAVVRDLDGHAVELLAPLEVQI